MKIFITTAALLVLTACKPAPVEAPPAAKLSTAEFDEALIRSMAGDYQAQRNLAYGYAAFPYPGQTKDPVRACAWYLVIQHSGHPQYGPGDEGNVKTYCGLIGSDNAAAAQELAQELLTKTKNP
jgi:hypothetical protein